MTNPDGTGEARDGPRPLAILVWGLHAGAFANLATALAAGLLRVGAGPVHLLYLKAGPGPTVTVPAGVELRPLNVRRSVALPLSLARYLHRERPRLLVTMPTVVTIPAFVGYFLAGRRVRARTKFVIYQGDTLGNDVSVEHAGSVRLRMLPVLARMLYRFADALTTCAPGVLALLERDRIRLPAHSRVIANPVDLDRYRRLALEPATHPWLMDKTGTVVTTLGRLAKRKNHAMLLRSFAQMRRSGLDARLVVFGEGPERGATCALAAELGLADHVSFAGAIQNPHAEIARSDLFVMSSIDEAFCLALVEAMACGVPVISTDAVGGGPRFILCGDKEQAVDRDDADADLPRAGLVPNDSDEALSEAMARALTDRPFRARLTQACRRRADDFGPEAIGREWVSFADSL